MKTNIRQKLINLFGEENLTWNTEKGEYSYKTFYNGHKFLDLRFQFKDISILCETKASGIKLRDKEIAQILDYTLSEESENKTKKIISILINNDGEIRVYKNKEFLDDEKSLDESREHYINLFKVKNTNNKEKVMQYTNELNESLKGYGISEKDRSQLVGTMLVALNHGLNYSPNSTTKQICVGIEEIIDNCLDGNTNKTKKLDVLRTCLNSQEVRELSPNSICDILDFINNNLIPYINDETYVGQDLLNLFFTTFNKYVGRADKNQAFTPDHIVCWMCKLANVNKNSKILDPTCGSGSFLVQALTQAIRTCDTDSDKEKVLKNNIFGFENEDKAFGLATTNMLIHKDGKSNICFGDCFEHKGTIGNSNINTILMNPPYNANYNKSNALKAILEDEYGYTEKKQQNNKKKEDPTKGLVFVNKICEWVGKGVCLCVLPLQAAIGNSTELAMAKKKLLDNNTLEAVYSMPNQLFYPGAAASVCVMQIRVGQRHNQDVPTFFGYFKDDGHMLKKNLGRVDTNNKWEDIEKKWLDAFVYKKIIPGLSVMKNVTHTDEWLAEAYMQTDYSKLSQTDFEKTIRDYLSYVIKKGEESDE